MPNWTANTITLRGDKQKRAAFKAKVKGENGDFDFNQIVRMPKELADTVSPTEVVATQKEADERNAVWKAHTYGGEEIRCITQEEADRRRKTYGSTNWYDWSRANWGTKWNACHIELSKDDDSLTYDFDTAWDAPRALIEPITTLAQELGLLIVWDADHEDGGYESIVGTEELAV